MRLLKRIIDKVKEDKDLLKKIVFTASARGIAALGTFIFNFALAKFLGVNDFGIFMLLYSIFIGIAMYVRYGNDAAIMRFAAIMFEKKQFSFLKQLQERVNKDLLIKSSIIGVLICITSPFIAQYAFNSSNMYKVLNVFAFTLLFYSYLIIQSSYLKAFKKPELAPFLEVGISSFITGSMVSLLAISGLKIDLFIVSLCLFLSCLLVFLFGKKILSKIIFIKKNNEISNIDIEENFDFSEYNRSLFDYFSTTMTTYLFKFSPTLILGYFATAKDVGLYSIANSTAFVINFILWIFSSVYAPHFAILYKEKEMDKLKRMLSKSIIYMSFMAVPIFLVIIIFPDYILSIFGKSYILAKDGLIIIAFAQLINVLTGPVYFLLNMTGNQRKLRIIILLTSIFCLVISLILIPKYGYIGAIISTAIGLVFQNALSFYYSKKILGF
jgi:O-antigen/teichoic acid export membrane protein